MVLDHSCFVRKLFFIATTMKIRSKDWQHSHPGPKRKKEPQQPSCLYSTHLWKILRTCLWWWSKGSYQHWLLISTYKEKNTLFRKNKDNFTFEGFGGAQWYLQSLVELWFLIQCIHWHVFPKVKSKENESSPLFFQEKIRNEKWRGGISGSPTHQITVLPFSSFSDEEQNCPEFTDLNIGNALSGTQLHVQLLLYTRENQDCSERLIEHNVTASEYLNTTKKIVFVIHGFRPTGSPPAWLGDVKELLLSVEDINLIIVDWNRGATTVNYMSAVENCKKVAEILKIYVDQMLVRQSIASVLNKCEEHGLSGNGYFK